MEISPPEDWKWIGDWLGRRAVLTPNREALFDVTANRRYTYDALNQRGNQLANQLRKVGIQKGDRVAFMLNNRVECIDAFVACGKLGAILVPLNTRLATIEHQEYITNVTPKVLIYESAFDKVVEEIHPNAPSITHLLAVDKSLLSDAQSYDRAVKKQSPNQPTRPLIQFEDPFFILPTGGTTGLPKGAILSHRHIFWNSINTIVNWGLSPTDVSPVIFPLFHTGGWNVLLIPLFHVGARILLWQKFDAVDTLRRIEGERCTVVIGVPTMYHMMINDPEFASTDFSSVRFWLSGGAPCPVSIMESFWHRGQEFAMGYGLTEVGPNNFYMPPGASKQKPTTVGLPFFHNEIRIVDENLEDLSRGEIGELLLRGPHAFSGYWNNPQATQETIEPDGWVHTGDLARQDDEGFVFITGRSKELIISGGENIFPVEIERVLDAHEMVDAVAVVGMPDEKWGEVPVAFVVITEGRDISEATLKEYMRSKLARYKVPKRVIFLEELPLTSTGKINRRELEKQAMDFTN